MSTNNQIIQDALREGNVIPETATVSAEQGEVGLRKLNQMMEEWEEDGVKLGYFEQDSTGDDIPIPAWAESAVTYKLALRLTATYGGALSLQSISVGEKAYKTVLRKAIAEGMKSTVTDHMPQGEAKLRSGLNIQTDN